MAKHGNGRRGQHPIGVVAERTGLTPDVLRVWERRYRAVQPKRTEGGQRVYGDADVERLRLMNLATGAGRSISQVARLDAEELARLVRDDEEARRRVALQGGSRGPRMASRDTLQEEVREAQARAGALDGAGLERVLRRSATLVGLPVFLEGVATPLLRQGGEERSVGRLALAVEQLVIVTLRRVLESIISALIVSSDAPNLLVATPAGDRHEIEAVMAAAVAAAEGWRVTYLGPGVPADDIAGAAANTGASAVGVTVSHVVGRERLLKELRTLRLRLPAAVPLLVGGLGAAALSPDLRGAGIRVIDSLVDLRTALHTVGKAAA